MSPPLQTDAEVETVIAAIRRCAACTYAREPEPYAPHEEFRSERSEQEGGSSPRARRQERLPARARRTRRLPAPGGCWASHRTSCACCPATSAFACDPTPSRPPRGRRVGRVPAAVRSRGRGHHQRRRRRSASRARRCLPPAGRLAAGRRPLQGGFCRPDRSNAAVAERHRAGRSVTLDPDSGSTSPSSAARRWSTRPACWTAPSRSPYLKDANRRRRRYKYPRSLCQPRQPP